MSQTLRVSLLPLILVLTLCVIGVSGCSGSDTPTTVPPPPATTPDQIAEQQRLAEEAKLAEERAAAETERRIQKNREVIDLMFDGMTLAEANELLAVPGVKTMSMGAGANEQLTYEWKLEGDITIKATFLNGKLSKKEMTE